MVIGRRVAVAASPRPSLGGLDPPSRPDGKRSLTRRPIRRSRGLFVQHTRRGLTHPPRRSGRAAGAGRAGVAGRHQDPLSRTRRPCTSCRHSAVRRVWLARRRRQTVWSPVGRLVAGRQAHRLPPSTTRCSSRRWTAPGRVALASRNGVTSPAWSSRRPLDRLRRGQPDVSFQREHGLVRDPSRPGRGRGGGNGDRGRQSSTRARCGCRKSARCCSSLIARAAGTSSRSFFGTTARRRARLSASLPGSIRTGSASRPMASGSPGRSTPRRPTPGPFRSRCGIRCRSRRGSRSPPAPRTSRRWRSLAMVPGCTWTRIAAATWTSGARRSPAVPRRQLLHDRFDQRVQPASPRPTAASWPSTRSAGVTARFSSCLPADRLSSQGPGLSARELRRQPATSLVARREVTGLDQMSARRTARIWWRAPERGRLGVGTADSGGFRAEERAPAVDAGRQWGSVRDRFRSQPARASAMEPVG